MLKLRNGYLPSQHGLLELHDLCRWHILAISRGNLLLKLQQLRCENFLRRLGERLHQLCLWLLSRHYREC